MAELSETESLEKFKQAIQNLEVYQTHNIRLEDKFLLRFLNTAKFDLNKAISRYENYYKTILNLPHGDLFVERNEAAYGKIIQGINDLLAQSLAKYGKKCYPASFYGLAGVKTDNNTDPKTQNPPLILGIEMSTIAHFIESENFFIHATYGLVSFFDAIQEINDPTGSHSFIFVEDQSGFSLKISKKVLSNQWFIKIFTSLIQSSLPIRIEKLYMANAPYIFKTFFKIIRVFLSQKMKSRIVFTEGSDGNQVLVEHLNGTQFVPDNLKGGENKAKNLEFDVEHQLLKIFPTRKNLNSEQN